MMKSFLRNAALGLCGLAAISATAQAAEHGKGTLNRKDAGESYQIQGEYTGTITTDGEEKKMGVRIIAQGDNKFNAVAYPGGLPGDGWNGTEKIKGSGTLENGEVKFSSADNQGGVGVVKDGELTLTVNGDKIGTLKRIERKSPTLGEKPPANAVVLFTGDKDQLKNFVGAKLADGYLTPGFKSVEEFGDQTLHLEFMLSYMPEARGQGRSNSGCYPQGRYEIQILDSFGLDPKDNECGGIYQIAAPKLNMCYPPLQWQTYDIDLTAAKFDGNGKKTHDAKITVRHNGVLIHQNLMLPHGTPGGTQGEGAKPGPLFIQDHGNQLYFNNIWVIKK